MNKPEVMAKDVAVYILRSVGRLPNKTLHCLLYYCQAWSLVWLGEELFSEWVEAGPDGPIVRSLLPLADGRYYVTPTLFRPVRKDVLSEAQYVLIDKVLEMNFGKYPEELSKEICTSPPWREARDHVASDKVIRTGALQSYYSSISLNTVVTEEKGKASVFNWDREVVCTECRKVVPRKETVEQGFNGVFCKACRYTEKERKSTAPTIRLSPREIIEEILTKCVSEFVNRVYEPTKPEIDHFCTETSRAIEEALQ